MNLNDLSGAQWRALLDDVNASVMRDEAGAFDLCQKFADQNIHTPHDVMTAAERLRAAGAIDEGVYDYLTTMTQLAECFPGRIAMSAFADEPIATCKRTRGGSSDWLFLGRPRL